MDSEQIRVEVNGEQLEVARGTPISSLFPNANHIVAARVNNAVRDLRFELTEDCKVHPLDVSTQDGMRIYRNSLVFVLARAAKEILKGCRLHVKHSLSNGYYGEIDYERPVVERDIQAIEERMKEIVGADIAFERKKLPISEASQLFLEQGLMDKVRLLEYTKRHMVTVYNCGWYHDYLSSVTVPSTGYLSLFKLRFYLPGFILEFPKRENPQVIPAYVEQGKLANVYFEAEKWGNIIGVSQAADLNACITQGSFDELVRVTEAYHEKQIAKIADEISKNRDRLRVILIAGPSSSGKTTFAQRLSVQLRVNGLLPVAISLDDYFVNREQTPKDDDGNYDFEALEAIDIKLFNEHLSKLIQGEAVELPIYDFTEGKRKWDGRSLSVSGDQPIIVEGIHGLNDKLTSSIPKGRKFKIYVSALTNLNVDDHTRVPTTDVRILRRIIRDYQFRNYKPEDTIQRWPSVRRGEERHIFPFQEQADVMFNSALVYELAVLKNHVQPLLRRIGQEYPQHSEARRLLRFLSHFQAVDSNGLNIPCNSILREFVGGSCFFK